MDLTRAQVAEFVRYARIPGTWAIAARRQLAVAKHLSAHERDLGGTPGSSFEERSGSHYAGYLHAGYAVENACKAALVKVDPLVVSERGSIDKSKFGDKNGHDLLSLAKLVLSDLNDEDIATLQKLQEYTIWAGRYTIPMRAIDLFDEERMNRMRSAPIDEMQKIESLVIRLLAEAE